MKHFEIKKGEWPPLAGPVQILPDPGLVRSVALIGTDTPGLRPRFEVSEGDRVDVGQPLFRDRKHPEIAFVSPLAGRVKSVAYGPRRTLSVCAVEAVENEAKARRGNDVPDWQAPRDALLASGHWPAFRTRPFGRMPNPDASPAAIFVNAVQKGPEAPEPAIVLAEGMAAFHLGLRVLAQLTEGEVFVCQSKGPALGPEMVGITCVSFGGTRAAALAGTHIDRLFPGRVGREVWTIGYQDVLAIGHLFQSGQYDPGRVVAIGGPGAHKSRLARTVLGAELSGLCAPDAGEALTGDAISGRPAAYLGRFDDQITVLGPPKPKAQRRRWLERFTVRHRVLIPTRALERALAVDIPPVPLLRALSVGDSETAERLGCLSLVEEDVAALARHCTSGADYALLLRDVLDDLREGAT